MSLRERCCQHCSHYLWSKDVEVVRPCIIACSQYRTSSVPDPRMALEFSMFHAADSTTIAAPPTVRTLVCSQSKVNCLLLGQKQGCPFPSVGIYLAYSLPCSGGGHRDPFRRNAWMVCSILIYKAVPLSYKTISLAILISNIKATPFASLSWLSILGLQRRLLIFKISMLAGPYNIL